MRRKCIACDSTSYIGDGNLSFHKVPTNESVQYEWLNSLGIARLQNFPADMYVCCDHFVENDYIERSDGKRTLRIGAIPKPIESVLGELNVSVNVEKTPVVNSDGNGIDKSSKIQTKITEINLLSDDEHDENVDDPKTKHNNKEPSLDHSYAVVNIQLDKNSKASFQTVNRSIPPEALIKVINQILENNAKVTSTRPQNSNKTMQTIKTFIAFKPENPATTPALPTNVHRIQVPINKNIFSNMQVKSVPIINNNKRPLELHTPGNTKKVRTDHDYAAEEVEYDTKITVLENIIKRQRKKIDFLNRRLKQHKVDCSGPEKDNIRVAITETASALFDTALRRTHQVKYHPLVKTFAVKLYKQSIGAYIFIRNAFGDIFPHPDTLDRWLSQESFEETTTDNTNNALDELVRSELEKLNADDEMSDIDDKVGVFPSDIGQSSGSEDEEFAEMEDYVPNSDIESENEDEVIKQISEFAEKTVSESLNIPDAKNEELVIQIVDDD